MLIKVMWKVNSLHLSLSFTNTILLDNDLQQCMKFNTLSMVSVGHRQIFDINVPHTHRQTYRQTDILHVPEF